jgi:hypothetical protein
MWRDPAKGGDMETRVTGFQTERNLSIVQLATSDQDSFDYVACGEAIRKGLIEVREINEGGSVNTILVLNNSKMFVFMMDGDILAGAKQNRVVNTSILLAPRSETKIPVSCVEHGRWRHTSPTFRETKAAAPFFLRADKARQVKESLKRGAGYSSNQGEIWCTVANYQRFYHVDSATSSLSDVFSAKADEFDQYVKRFAPLSGSNGMAVFFGKHLAGVDVFNRREVFSEYFPKLLQGAAMEAASLEASKEPLTEAEARYRTLELLDSIEHQQFQEQPGVGVGVDKRFESPGLNGFELEYSKHLIHLAAFKAPERRTGNTTMI